MKYLISYLLFIIAIVALYGAAYSVNKEEHPGQKVFVDQKCISCHSVEAVGLISKSKKDNPDLSKYEGELDKDFFINYMKKEVKINDKAHPAAFKGTDEELNDFVDWFIILNTKAPATEGE